MTDPTSFPKPLNVRDQLGGFGLREVQQEPSCRSLEDLDRLEDVLFGFFAESRYVAELLLAREFFDVVHRARFELAPEQRHLLRAQRMHCEQIENRFGIFLEQLLAQAVVAGFDDFLDMLGQPFAHAGKLGQLLGVAREVGHRLGKAGDEFRGALVAAIAADDGAVDFQELRGVLQDARDLSIFHGLLSTGDIPSAVAASGYWPST